MQAQRQLKIALGGIPIPVSLPYSTCLLAQSKTGNFQALQSKSTRAFRLPDQTQAQFIDLPGIYSCIHEASMSKSFLKYCYTIDPLTVRMLWWLRLTPLI